jgi:hypothetical protein
MAPQPPPRKPSVPPRPAGARTPPPGGTPQPASVGNTGGSKRQLARPPIAPVIIGLVMLILLVIVTLGVSRDSVNLHLFASIVGLFGSVSLLGWFRQTLNIRKSTGSFSEWPGRWESTRYMWLLVTLAWLGGAANVYFAVYELVRPK